MVLTPSSSWRGGVVTGLLLVLVSLPGAAQEEAPSKAPEFFERIGVDIVNLDVYVTDNQGNPVEGLTVEDFLVTEDGKPVEVVNFYRAFEEGSSASTAEPPSQEETTSDAPAEQRPDPLSLRPEASPVPDAQRLHLIVYVDNFNIHPLNRNRVFARLRDFLRETLRPGDEVLIATYDRSLHVQLPFTRSSQEASRSLLDLEKMSGSAVERESERKQALAKIYESETLHEAQFAAKQYSENQYHEMGNSLGALSEMIDSLGGLPGRKMLIHLSDGIPIVPGQDLYQAVQQRFVDQSALMEAFTRDLSRDYMQLITEANSNRVSFYTIDASGLSVRSGFGAENATVDNNYAPVGLAVDGVRIKNLQGSLKLMANRTGGQAIVNTNDVKDGLERMALDLRHYYSLGYRAPTTDRGRYHRIEVRLATPRRGWQLRYREGYRDKSVEARMRDSAKAYLAHGYESNPLDVAIDIGPQSENEDGMVAVPIRVRVPMEQLVLLPRGDFYEGRLMIYFGASDPDGREAPLQELPFDLRIPAASIEVARRDQVARIIDAKMRPGPHRLVVAVRDELGDQKSVVGHQLMVGE